MRPSLLVPFLLSLTSACLAQEPPRYEGPLRYDWQKPATADEVGYAAYLARAAGAQPGPAHRLSHDLHLAAGRAVLTAGLQVDLEGLQVQRYDLTRSREADYSEPQTLPAVLFGHQGRGATQAADYVARRVFDPEIEPMRTPFVFEARGPEILSLYGQRVADPDARARLRVEGWRYRPAQGETTVWGYYSGDGEWAVETNRADGPVASRCQGLLDAAQAAAAGEPASFDLTRSPYHPSRVSTVTADAVLASSADHAIVRLGRQRVVEVWRTANGYRWLVAHRPEGLDALRRVLPGQDPAAEPQAGESGLVQAPVKGIVDRIGR